MDKYQKLKAVQGLIISLDEQIYRLDGLKLEPLSHEHQYNLLLNNYYKSIKDFLNEESS